jgi:hypothetical protein
LFLQGQSVIFELGTQNLFQIPDKVDKNTVFVIDNAPFSKSFYKFLEIAIQNEYKVIFAARVNEWNVYQIKNAISDRDYCPIEIKKISEKEAEQFAEYIVTNIETKNSKEDIMEIFLKQNSGFLFAAMLISVYDKSLENIAKNIISNIDNINEYVLKVLTYVCFVESLDQKVNQFMYHEFYSLRKLRKKTVNDTLAREVQIIRNYVETRNPVISKVFSQILFCAEASWSRTCPW